MLGSEDVKGTAHIHKKHTVLLNLQMYFNQFCTRWHVLCTKHSTIWKCSNRKIHFSNCIETVEEGFTEEVIFDLGFE